jgi:hypothetical protein
MNSSFGNIVKEQFGLEGIGTNNFGGPSWDLSILSLIPTKSFD